MTKKTKLAAVILAAGLGKRMKSTLPKVLHQAAGRTLLDWVARAARAAGAGRMIAVVGPELSAAEKERYLGGFEVVVQRERLGTGHAVMQAVPCLESGVDEVLVLCGDVPCITPETLGRLVADRRSMDAAAAVLTMVLDDPAAYGRIVRAGERVTGIVEHKDASPEIRAVREVNTGEYAFRAADLLEMLPRLENKNAQGEYYLTDVIKLLVDAGRPVAGVITPDPGEVLGVNTPDELAVVDQILAIRSQKP